ncbi:MAG TPA: hypothetical protein VLS90_14500 [Thermodesulfobacteriota bacterium]|nr:hypothetical protein [Thermodesulfobacteriota bacterium]
MLGGLARRADFEEKLRAQNSALIVDSGDLYFDPRSGEAPDKKLTKARIIGRAYRHMSASAVNVGDFDLLQGIDFLRQEASQGTPLVSSNLLDPSTKTPIFPTYVIREAGGLRIAFFGLASPEFPPDIAKALKEATEGKVLIKDPTEAARETVQKIQGKADLVVLLSDLGTFKDHALVRAVPGIHFILGGHEGRFIARPEQSGKTFILQSSAKGMYVGQLKLKVENPSWAFKNEGEAQQLQERINGLEGQIRTLQNARQQQSGTGAVNLDRAIQDLTRQKAGLQDQLRQSRDASSSNRFEWQVVSIESRHPENDQVRKWVSEAGIDKD